MGKRNFSLIISKGLYAFGIIFLVTGILLSILNLPVQAVAGEDGSCDTPIGYTYLEKDESGNVYSPNDPSYEGHKYFTYSTGSDVTIDGIYIKIGSDNGSSPNSGPGCVWIPGEESDLQDGCYLVSGVGTSTVTVTELFKRGAPEHENNPNECKEISHVSFYKGIEVDPDPIEFTLEPVCPTIVGAPGTDGNLNHWKVTNTGEADASFSWTSGSNSGTETLVKGDSITIDTPRTGTGGATMEVTYTDEYGVPQILNATAYNDSELAAMNCEYDSISFSVEPICPTIVGPPGTDGNKNHWVVTNTGSRTADFTWWSGNSPTHQTLSLAKGDSITLTSPRTADGGEKMYVEYYDEYNQKQQLKAVAWKDDTLADHDCIYPDENVSFSLDQDCPDYEDMTNTWYVENTGDVEADFTWFYNSVEQATITLAAGSSEKLTPDRNGDGADTITIKYMSGTGPQSKSDTAWTNDYAENEMSCTLPEITISFSLDQDCPNYVNSTNTWVVENTGDAEATFTWYYNNVEQGPITLAKGDKKTLNPARNGDGTDVIKISYMDGETPQNIEDPAWTNEYAAGEMQCSVPTVEVTLTEDCPEFLTEPKAQYNHWTVKNEGSVDVVFSWVSGSEGETDVALPVGASYAITATRTGNGVDTLAVTYLNELGQSEEQTDTAMTNEEAEELECSVPESGLGILDPYCEYAGSGNWVNVWVVENIGSYFDLDFTWTLLDKNNSPFESGVGTALVGQGPVLVTKSDIPMNDEPDSVLGTVTLVVTWEDGSESIFTDTKFKADCEPSDPPEEPEPPQEIPPGPPIPVTAVEQPEAVDAEILIPVTGEDLTSHNNTWAYSSMIFAGVLLLGSGMVLQGSRRKQEQES